MSKRFLLLTAGCFFFGEAAGRAAGAAARRPPGGQAQAGGARPQRGGRPPAGAPFRSARHPPRSRAAERARRSGARARFRDRHPSFPHRRSGRPRPLRRLGCGQTALLGRPPGARPLSRPARLHRPWRQARQPDHRTTIHGHARAAGAGQPRSRSGAADRAAADRGLHHPHRPGRRRPGRRPGLPPAGRQGIRVCTRKFADLGTSALLPRAAVGWQSARAGGGDRRFSEGRAAQSAAGGVARLARRRQGLERRHRRRPRDRRSQNAGVRAGRQILGPGPILWRALVLLRWPRRRSTTAQAQRRSLRRHHPGSRAAAGRSGAPGRPGELQPRPRPLRTGRRRPVAGASARSGRAPARRPEKEVGEAGRGGGERPSRAGPLHRGDPALRAVVEVEPEAPAPPFLRGRACGDKAIWPAPGWPSTGPSSSTRTISTRCAISTTCSPVSANFKRSSLIGIISWPAIPITQARFSRDPALTIIWATPPLPPEICGGPASSATRKPANWRSGEVRDLEPFCQKRPFLRAARGGRGRKLRGAGRARRGAGGAHRFARAMFPARVLV